MWSGDPQFWWLILHVIAVRWPIFVKIYWPYFAPNSEDIFNIETFFAWKTSAPKMDEGCLLWQTWSQHWSPFWLNHSAPNWMPFMTEDTTFLYRLSPRNECILWQACSQHWKLFFLKQNAPEMDAFQQRPFLILSVKPIFCWNLMPPKPMPFMSKMLSTLNLFCLTQCTPKWMALWKMFSMWSQFF